MALAGFDTPATIRAGQALPVTLYWRAEQEAQQDYLVSLCLHDPQNRPIACWRGPFANGRYPARAWEAGDTLADTVFIPIPACSQLAEQTYRLHLELWPLDPNSPEPSPVGPPLVQQTFTEPPLTLRPIEASAAALPQTADVWRGSQHLTGPTPLYLGDTLTWLDYPHPDQEQAPRFVHQASGVDVQESIPQQSLWAGIRRLGDFFLYYLSPNPLIPAKTPQKDYAAIWSPIPEFNTPLYSPCAGDPQLSTFIAGPTLLPGPYFPDAANAPPDLTLLLNLRQRTFAPMTSTLVFTPYLAPLTVQFPNQPPVELEEWKAGSREQPSNPRAEGPLWTTLQPSNLPPASLLPVTLRWQARRWMADPLVVSLKLLDKDFQIGGERQATLGDRYPNVLWVPGETVEETYPLRLNPDAPPGLYRLEISLLRQDKTLPDGYEYIPLTGSQPDLGHNLYPATFRLLDPADGTLPPYPLSAQLGDSIQLIGYNLEKLSIINGQSSIINGKEPIALALYWQSKGKIPAAHTVFTQLVGPDGQVWAQWDNPPQAGRYPTTAWTEQDQVVDRYALTLRDGAPPGEYRLLAGMYDPATGQRLPVLVNGQPQPDNAVVVTTLSLAP